MHEIISKFQGVKRNKQNRLELHTQGGIVLEINDPEMDQFLTNAINSGKIKIGPS